MEENTVQTPTITILDEFHVYENLPEVVIVDEIHGYAGSEDK